MTPKTGLVEDKSDDGGAKFIDVADMSEKREKAKTLCRESIHKAVAGQEDADQEGLSQSQLREVAVLLLCRPQ
jgi:hypothetical protein